ncbi:hypothetical protein XELAEV_18022816mg [Xenopus laevis]|uniref:Uncharacterized protein n=1 Tax=Xenopus laevis TaxID=8355 RepID=A0A974HNI5_XENLA|nr:hypothetical protein XELAEV_18022816mg [Xenopus laevis]
MASANPGLLPLLGTVFTGAGVSFLDAGDHSWMPANILGDYSWTLVTILGCRRLFLGAGDHFCAYTRVYMVELLWLIKIKCYVTAHKGALQTAVQCKHSLNCSFVCSQVTVFCYLSILEAKRRKQCNARCKGSTKESTVYYGRG